MSVDRHSQLFSINPGNVSSKLTFSHLLETQKRQITTGSCSTKNLPARFTHNKRIDVFDKLITIYAFRHFQLVMCTKRLCVHPQKTNIHIYIYVYVCTYCVDTRGGAKS